MVSSRLLLFLSAIFILTAQAVALNYFRDHFCSNDKGNYTANRTYEANLNHLLSSLYSNTEIDYGFYNSSYGQNSDEVHAIGLCRGDVNPRECRDCLKNATSDLLNKLCPIQKEAIVSYDYCILRYSNPSIFGILETKPTLSLGSPSKVWAYVDQFNDDLRTLMDKLRSHAVTGDSLRKFAAGNTAAPSSQTIYGIVQCTPDLSQQDCNSCLVEAIQTIPDCCDQKVLRKEISTTVIN